MPTLLNLMLAFVLISTFLFGGVVHELLPHTHSVNPVIAENMHAALRHEEKNFFNFSFPLLFLAVFFAPLFLRGAVRALTVRSTDSEHDALRRGVVAYRAFR